ncbi:adenylate isopentenyltransferase-like [Nicotiana tomentosiformis]|uniref:adenylate isopentenyltransferase-like n=1 Tax=Nicotiana tomentosiformis TaxID=4098 RepID=UPI001447FEBD|nr:adenylate isopentenyltransferase-like [Nicotiana tomentosiformis]
MATGRTVVGPTNKNKIVVVMGATGSGKSKLSIDLATRYFPNSEIINSDKIQISKGLDITTNKISMSERRGVFHHLLGEFSSEFSPSDFRWVASDRISDIINRNKLPLIVGGSNSFIYAFLSNRFEPGLDVFNESNPVQCISKELLYNCCFIWVDVLTPVLNQYLFKRVDEMMKSGMYEELEEFFEKNGFSGANSASRHSGLRKAIGVPEMERYFQKYKNCTVEEKCRLYEEAVREIQENTRQLAEKQIWKIQRLREAGWDLQRVDATEAFTAAMTPGNTKIPVPATEIWEKQVVKPSVKIVKRFLFE